MSKNNERLWRVVRVTLFVVAIIASAAVAYGILTERVDTNSNRIEKVEQKADSNQLSIVEIKTDLKYIIKGVDDIKKEMRIRLTDE